MGLLDQFRQRKDKEKEKTEGHPIPPPAGHTLAEVMQDKTKSDLFLKLLRKNDDALAMRLAQGKLQESDISLLEDKRKIFSEKITQAEKVEKLLTEENVVDFARNHPDFEKIINLLGPKKAVKAIQSQLKELSVSDEEDRFNKIVHALNEYDKYKNGEYKVVNDEVKKLVTRSYKWYDKVLNMTGHLSKDAVKDLQSSEDSPENSVAQLDLLYQEIGTVL